jgi:hypothetical protein
MENMNNREKGITPWAIGNNSLLIELSTDGMETGVFDSLSDRSGGLGGDHPTHAHEGKAASTVSIQDGCN